MAPSEHIIKDYLRSYPHDGYLRYHAPRYRKLLKLAQGYYQDGQLILDIGRSRLTDMLATTLDAKVDTLDFYRDAHHTGFHYCFDLNNTPYPETWPTDLPQYDLIVFAEIIEHLYVSPNFVFTFLHHHLRPQGKLLLQTPNAVDLYKRMAMLLGKNPYEPIRENPKNPGHFREYTRREIEQYAAGNSFKVLQAQYENYFDFYYSEHTDASFNPKARFKLLNAVYRLAPGPLKPGMSFVLEKKG